MCADDSPAPAAILDAIAFDSDGLVPAIAQQHDSGEVLMMAWMNRDAVAETLAAGRVCYWSRSRARPVFNDRSSAISRRQPMKRRFSAIGYRSRKTWKKKYSQGSRWLAPQRNRVACQHWRNRPMPKRCLVRSASASNAGTAMARCYAMLTSAHAHTVVIRVRCGESSPLARRLGRTLSATRLADADLAGTAFQLAYPR